MSEAFDKDRPTVALDSIGRCRCTRTNSVRRWDCSRRTNRSDSSRNRLVGRARRELWTDFRRCVERFSSASRVNERKRWKWANASDAFRCSAESSVRSNERSAKRVLRLFSSLTNRRRVATNRLSCPTACFATVADRRADRPDSPWRRHWARSDLIRVYIFYSATDWWKTGKRNETSVWRSTMLRVTGCSADNEDSRRRARIEVECIDHSTWSVIAKVFDRQRENFVRWWKREDDARTEHPSSMTIRRIWTDIERPGRCSMSIIVISLLSRSNKDANRKKERRTLTSGDAWSRRIDVVPVERNETERKIGNAFGYFFSFSPLVNLRRDCNRFRFRWFCCLSSIPSQHEQFQTVELDMVFRIIIGNAFVSYRTRALWKVFVFISSSSLLVNLRRECDRFRFRWFCCLSFDTVSTWIFSDCWAWYGISNHHRQRIRFKLERCGRFLYLIKKKKRKRKEKEKKQQQQQHTHAYGSRMKERIPVIIRINNWRSERRRKRRTMGFVFFDQVFKSDERNSYQKKETCNLVTSVRRGQRFSS